MEPANNDNPARQQQPPPPPPPPPSALRPPPSHRNCPRCNSSNTKFCYFNNYSFSQPRHFCKACRRYWTHGGTLRNIPFGGGIRRNNSNLPPRGHNSAPLRAPPPLMNTSFISGSGGGVFLPASYAPMQASSSAARVNLGGFGDGIQLGVNLSLLEAMSLHSSETPAANQFQPPGDMFPGPQNLMNPLMRPWAKNSSANTDGASSSNGSTFWNIAGVGDQDGPSFSALDDWLTDDDWWTDDDDEEEEEEDDDDGDDDNNPGFNPSQ